MYWSWRATPGSLGFFFGTDSALSIYLRSILCAHKQFHCKIWALGVVRSETMAVLSSDCFLSSSCLSQTDNSCEHRAFTANPSVCPGAQRAGTEQFLQSTFFCALLFVILQGFPLIRSDELCKTWKRESRRLSGWRKVL